MIWPLPIFLGTFPCYLLLQDCILSLITHSILCLESLTGPHLPTNYDGHRNFLSFITHVSEIFPTPQAQSDSHHLLATLYFIYLLTSLHAP